MLAHNIGRERALMLASALIITAWGSVALYQGLHTGFSGGLYDTEYRIGQFGHGSLAERSGLKPGDRVISVEGRPVEELGMESRWPRSLVPRAGESRRFLIDRNGERILAEVVFPAPFRAAVNNRIRAAVTGLAWLLFGVWAFMTVDTRPARTLAYAGLAAGLSAAFGGHISTAAGVLMFILLLQFFVTFPGPKRVSESRTAAWLVYGAWGGLIVFLVVEMIVHPALYYTTGSVAGPLTLAYAVLILAAIIHSFVKLPREDLRASGMFWIAGGLLLGILGVVLPFALPDGPPGWLNALVMAAIPLSMFLAVRKHARSETLLQKARASAA
jgi:hypothetical protein